MPDVQRVVADYTAPDPTDARIREAAACHVMSDAVELFMGARYFRGEFRGEEKARRDAYASCVGNRVGTRTGDTRAMRRKITSGEGDLRRNPQFVAEVTSRYLAPGDLQTYRRLSAQAESRDAAATARARADTAQQNAFLQARRQKSQATLAALGAAVIGTLALTAWLLSRNLPGFRIDAESTPPVLKARGRTYTLHTRGGVIAQLDKQHRTHHVPGSTTYDGQGRYVSSTSGYSYTTTKDTVFLLDKDGAEHAMKLENWDVTARGGHMLGALWAIAKGKEYGSYLMVWNFSIDRVQTDTHLIGRIVGVTAKTVVFAALSTLILAIGWDIVTQHLFGPRDFLLAFIVLVAGLVARRLINGSRVKRFQREVAPIRDRIKADAEVALLRANGLTEATEQP
ncbi:hypothetical protein [Phenylobacterium sp.]|uniref:hypothetical protein n=1 Tax=Phenylobacterium sp. TaxID=1871053 RepID=UPI0025DB9A73|nr:hypothetical protein [Phenylobacterium sp.]MBX3483213.1 hypothetical protein [Phenylobacterium sp.]